MGLNANNQRGFTLLEAIVVVVLVVILATLIVVFGNK
ncbi:prepilin-type N-terminal cleavage/methylation domain-containing protein [Candidatus Saccharibacteria bacterium]|nr:prepilin-type N-terminal cleavage/methylation domain-containing protein [Candidatus Saccharibacteria bacterium]